MKRKIRVIPRLDIKGQNLIKGVHLEGLKIIGDPNVFATQYYSDGADELLYMDSVASLYGRNNILEIVTKTASDIFIPLTVGGGIRTLENAKSALRSGADKIALNTAAIANPALISEIATFYGNQCVVVSIEAKYIAPGKWEVYTDNGREKTGIDAVKWASDAAKFGAGEILITSIDQEGTKKGFDIDLVKAICDSVDIQVIASGGMGNLEHLKELVEKTDVNAIAVANVLHHKNYSLPQIKNFLKDLQYEVRIV